MRSSYVLCLLGLSLLVFSLTSCSPAPNFWAEAKSGQKKVLVSFPPVYSIAHAIGGENAYVLCLLTAQGPHEYDGAATDLFKVNKADLFIFNGLTLDDNFADKMLRNHKNKSLAVLKVGKVLEAKHDKLLIHEEGHDHAHDKDKKEDEHA